MGQFRKAKKRKKMAAISQSSAKSGSGSSPVITHDLSWTKGRSYEEDDDDTALSDLLKSLQDSDSVNDTSVKKEVPASSPETEAKSAPDIPEQTTDSRQESDDDDDTFEIVDIDKLQMSWDSRPAKETGWFNLRKGDGDAL